jgi:uncharacterized protein YccT (UPF0319 family)
MTGDRSGILLQDRDTMLDQVRHHQVIVRVPAKIMAAGLPSDEVEVFRSTKEVRRRNDAHPRVLPSPPCNDFCRLIGRVIVRD